MKLTNTWVGYLDRSYEQIKTKFLQRVNLNAPELTDHSPNNPLIILVEFFAGVTEMLNYYIDSMAREAFLATAERYDSVVHIVKMLDYRIKARYPETVDLTFTLDNPAPIGGGLIPAGTICQGGEYQWVTTEDLVIPEGDTIGVVGAKQQVKIDNIILGTSNGTAIQQFVISQDYAHGSLQIEVDSEPYDLVDTFAYSSSTDKHCIVEINANKQAVVQFGNGNNGMIPTNGQDIVANYYQTSGPLGAASINLIDNIISTINITGVTEIEVTNTLRSSGGSFVESLTDIKFNAPLLFRTVERAVTREDYNLLAGTYPGVFKSKLQLYCNKTVNIFIAPTAGPAGGIASIALLNDIEQYFETRRMYTTKVKAFAAGLSNIKIGIDATAKYRRDPVEMGEDIKTALLEKYNYNASRINRPIRIADIYSLVDNLAKVDFLTLTKLVLVPYARPLEHTNALNWEISILDSNEDDAYYSINYAQAGQWVLLRNGAFFGVYNFGDTVTFPAGELTVNSSPIYDLGNAWGFKTYPSTTDIEVDDFTVPVLLQADIDLTVNPSNDNTELE